VIDRYGFFGVDTDISAIHGPIADTDKPIFSNFLNVVFYFIINYFFFKNFKNQDL